MFEKATMIPIQPPGFDPLAAYGIAGLSVVVATLYVLLLADDSAGDGRCGSRSPRRRFSAPAPPPRFRWLARSTACRRRWS